jgi:hypothetical protein
VFLLDVLSIAVSREGRFAAAVYCTLPDARVALEKVLLPFLPAGQLGVRRDAGFIEAEVWSMLAHDVIGDAVHDDAIPR